MKLTKEQFNNMGLLDAELRKILPAFKGFNGSKDNMQVMGADEAVVKQEIDRLDIAQLKVNDPIKIKRDAVIDKLKGLGFTADDIEVLNLR